MLRLKVYCIFWLQSLCEVSETQPKLMILHLAWAQCLEELRLQDRGHAVQLDE